MGLFSVSSFSFSSSLPSPPFHCSTIWYPIVPPKIQGFLWKIAWRRALTQPFSEAPPQSCFVTQNLLSLFCQVRIKWPSNYTQPFTWKLWGKFSRTIKLYWAVPNSIPSLISKWRAFPLFSQTQKAMEFMSSRVIMVIWKERNRRIFENVYGDFICVWDSFLYSVASWVETGCSFLVFLLTISLVIWGGFSLLRRLTPNPTHP